MPVITLTGNYGYQSYGISGVATGTIINASAASWIQSNSRNDNPDANTSYNEGPGLLNLYPFWVYNGSDVVLIGGKILGEVPLTSDWLYTYNNSAGVLVKYTPGVIIDEWRIDQSWDAIRIGPGATNFLIDDVYVTRVRDDAIENDDVLSGTIRDSLFDGVFSGLSLGDADLVDGSANTVTLEAVFLRCESYLYDGVLTHVSPFKMNSAAPATSPDLRIINSVIAIEDPHHLSQKRLEIAWENVVESRGNVFLNLSDIPLPANYPLPPAGFTVLQGQAARDYWAAAKAAWLDNHDGTPISDVTHLPPLPGASPAVGAETAPLLAGEINYALQGTIAASGEVDRVSISLVAGTSYRFDLLGAGTLGEGNLPDGGLQLVNSSGVIVASDSDSGIGRDSTLVFTASATGTYTLQAIGASGSTGSYLLQAAAVGGAATLAGTGYMVSNSATVVLEARGGTGEDVIRSSVSYTLPAGSEIEVLRTSNDKGKSGLNLTGNEFAQQLVGNSGKNVLDGRGGADTLTGGAGRDVFMLGSAAGGIARITDYASGDVVDVSRVLNVPAGTDVIAGGYLRVTTAGLIQVDSDGGANSWTTLATVNATSAITFRYLSDGSGLTVSSAPVADSGTVSTLSVMRVLDDFSAVQESAVRHDACDASDLHSAAELQIPFSLDELGFLMPFAHGELAARASGIGGADLPPAVGQFNVGGEWEAGMLAGATLAHLDSREQWTEWQFDTAAIPSVEPETPPWLAAQVLGLIAPDVSQQLLDVWAGAAWDHGHQALTEVGTLALDAGYTDAGFGFPSASPFYTLVADAQPSILF